MSYDVLKFPSSEFIVGKPAYFEQGQYPEFCRCDHKEHIIHTALNSKGTYDNYKCEVCKFEYNIDSSD